MSDLNCPFCKKPIDTKNAELNIDRTWIKCKSCGVWTRPPEQEFREALSNL